MIATDLSEFTSPRIPELTVNSTTLSDNVLASCLGAFSGETNSHVRHLMTNIVRRAFGSIEMYNSGRKHAFEYTSDTGRQRIKSYFLALAGFECSISYCWQVCDLLRDMTGVDLFPREGDRSAWHRLNQIYNQGIKHSYGKYDGDRDGEAPTTVWLTNDGIACLTGVMVSYGELAEAIAANNELFYEVQARALAKRRGAAASEEH
jgi:hypothetical protein